MTDTLIITSGDIAGDSLKKSGIEGEVFVWHDILYTGPRNTGWPDSSTLERRAAFLEDTTGAGLKKDFILTTLQAQYKKLKAAGEYKKTVLWFDACLFDQSMLCHILNCLRLTGRNTVELVCIDSFPEIVPYHGLGQLSPEQLYSVSGRGQPVTEGQFDFAVSVDDAFAIQDQAAFSKISQMTDAPLQWVPAAVRRWMEEFPDKTTGLGKLERLVLEAVRSGKEKPKDIFSFVSEKETPPQFWGDITIWAKINDLAYRNPPLVRIEGPAPRLPQWEGISDLKLFGVFPIA